MTSSIRKTTGRATIGVQTPRATRGRMNMIVRVVVNTETIAAPDRLRDRVYHVGDIHLVDSDNMPWWLAVAAIASGWASNTTSALKNDGSYIDSHLQTAWNNPTSQPVLLNYDGL